jgi:hypothetical protein
MPSKVIRLTLLALLLGCDERERLTFETDPTDRVGPSTQIHTPSGDTVLTEGDLFVVGARAIDTSGIDTVFITVEGANLNYLPIDANGVDTLDFALNFPTIGLSGRTIVLGISGVDLIGNLGSTVTRRLTIQ